MKKYKLIDSNGNEYFSDIPGTLGGNKKLKIYGKLDSSSANRWISKGYYVDNRVFFENEEIAIAVGYRPCAVCMKEAYNKWKENKIRNKRYEMCKRQRKKYAYNEAKELLEKLSKEFIVDDKGMVRQIKK